MPPWIPIAQFVMTIFGSVGTAALALYARAIRAELRRDILDETDKRYVRLDMSNVTRQQDIAELRALILNWRTEDRHLLRNEFTRGLAEQSQEFEERINELWKEVRGE